MSVPCGQAFISLWSPVTGVRCCKSQGGTIHTVVNANAPPGAMQIHLVCYMLQLTSL